MTLLICEMDPAQASHTGQLQGPCTTSICPVCTSTRRYRLRQITVDYIVIALAQGYGRTRPGEHGAASHTADGWQQVIAFLINKRVPYSHTVKSYR